MTANHAERGLRSSKVIFLSAFQCGSYGTVVELTTVPELQGRLMGMGLFVGTRFQLLQGGQQSSLPLILAIGNTRIAISQEVADVILVEQ